MLIGMVDKRLIIKQFTVKLIVSKGVDFALAPNKRMSHYFTGCTTL